MEKYDVIVVGAGNAGLTGAVTLANAGKKVLLIEQHNITGGCATSFVRGRFEFEVAFHEFMDGVGVENQRGDVFDLIKNLGIEDKVSVVPVKGNSIVSVLPSGKRVVQHHTSTIDQMIGEMIQAFPEEQAGIVGLMTELGPYMQNFDEYMTNEAMQNNSEDYSDDKFAPMRKHFFSTLDDIYDKYQISPELRVLFNSKLSYYGCISSDTQPGFILAQVMQFLEDGTYIEGGSQSISTALAEQFREQGGKLLLNTRVEKIIVENSQTKGVITADGTRYDADYVLSNIIQSSTYYDLIGEDKTPTIEQTNMDSVPMGFGCCNLYLGLDCAPEDVGIDSGFYFVFDGYDFKKIKKQWSSFEFPDHYLVSCHTSVHPGASAPGTSTVSIYNHQTSEHWTNLKPEEYYEKKQEYTRQMLARVEEQFPGICGHIEEMELATPVTLMRYINQPGGSLSGWDVSNQSLMFSRFTMIKSPIQGLFMAGSGILPGFHGTYRNGTVAAGMMLQEMEAK